MNMDKYLSIGALTKYLKHKFDTDNNLKTIYLKGEISNFKAHTTGHFYFSLKDDISKINAIMFNSSAQKILFTPKEGMNVLVKGRISIYEATGNYQIYIDEMLEDGVGNLHIAFEQLKEKLSKEGLFDDQHKRVITKIPKRVGIVTAATGAAVKDVISTIERRFPICEIILFPSLVQGDNAAADIVRNIALAQNYELDTLIVGRGGGSIEDLWPFNEEIVARAIHLSKVPIISAVGHEIDYTISDFVADLRAPTPTSAAEMAVPNIIDLSHNINQMNIRLNESIYKVLNFQKLYLDSIKNSFVIKNPMVMYENKHQRLDLLNEKIKNIINYKLERSNTILTNIKNNNILTNPTNLYKYKQIELVNIMSKLELINPLSILKRGYTLTYVNDKMIKSVKEITENDILKIKYHDGEIVTKVEKVEE